MNTEITDLPSNVIDDILLRLPLEAAARTSVLSTKWRYLWARRRELIFDYDFCQAPEESELESSDYLAWKYKLLSTIYQILLHHQAPILKFEFSTYEEMSFSEIDVIIKFLSRSVVQDLTLRFLSEQDHQLPTYILPSYFFSCLCLKKLSLSCCVINPPPSFRGFSEVVSLDLFEVAFTDGIAQSFFDCFPQLEALSIVCSKSDVEIYSSRLRFIDLKGDFSLCFKHIPKLDSAVISAATWLENFDKSILLLRTVQSLELFLPYQFGDTINVLLSRSIKLTNLKNLAFTCFNVKRKEHIEAAFWLISRATNLESVMIQLHQTEVGEERVAYEDDKMVLELFRHVSELQFRYREFHEEQLEIIKFVLAKSPKLKSFILWPSPFSSAKAEPGIIKYISELPRASKTAKVRSTYGYEDSVVTSELLKCLLCR